MDDNENAADQLHNMWPTIEFGEKLIMRLANKLA